MKLLAISDLHVSSPVNMQALAETPPHPTDWLIVAGDVAESLERLQDAFGILAERFAKIIWVPGNHELWTVPGPKGKGVAKYEAVVDLAREFGIITPEDPFPVWTGEGGPCVICPLFLLYDYSFRPDDVPLEAVVAWARAEQAVCADEMLLDPTPFASRVTWCQSRVRETEARLDRIGREVPKVLVNHYPLRRDLVYIPRIPRFSPWCGTVQTEDWHVRFNARVVISGHLHVRRTDWRDGTRFEEVSLGYPRQWDQELGIQSYIRTIFPDPAPA